MAEAPNVEDYRLAEYDGLIRHLIDRAANRRQLLTITLAAAGVIAGYALAEKGDPRAIISVPIVFFISYFIMWHETDEIIRIQKYIRTEIEPGSHGIMKWETRLYRNVQGYRIGPVVWTGVLYEVLAILITLYTWDNAGTLGNWQSMLSMIFAMLLFAVLIYKPLAWRIESRVL